VARYASLPLSTPVNDTPSTTGHCVHPTSSEEIVMSQSFQEQVAEATAHVPALSPQEAHQRLVEKPGPLFIDPRGEADIRATTGIIPGALSVPLDALGTADDGELPAPLADRDRAIITACQGGPMGAIAAYTLQRRGYTDVRYITGGTQAWLDAGFTTEK
jgi:rhodanese-related sulfurtransferase